MDSPRKGVIRSPIAISRQQVAESATTAASASEVSFQKSRAALVDVMRLLGTEDELENVDFDPNQDRQSLAGGDRGVLSPSRRADANPTPTSQASRRGTYVIAVQPRKPVVVKTPLPTGPAVQFRQAALTAQNKTREDAVMYNFGHLTTCHGIPLGAVDIPSAPINTMAAKERDSRERPIPRDRNGGICVGSAGGGDEALLSPASRAPEPFTCQLDPSRLEMVTVEGLQVRNLKQRLGAFGRRLANPSI